MDEIRRLKSLLVKHEKRIRALEARAASSPSADLNNSTGSANTSLVADSPPATTAINPQQPATTGSGQLENNHVTHDTKANVAKTIAAEDMAPDEVWTHNRKKLQVENKNCRAHQLLNHNNLKSELWFHLALLWHTNTNLPTPPPSITRDD